MFAANILVANLPFLIVIVPVLGSLDFIFTDYLPILSSLVWTALIRSEFPGGTAIAILFDGVQILLKQVLNAVNLIELWKNFDVICICFRIFESLLRANSIIKCQVCLRSFLLQIIANLSIVFFI